MKSQIFINLPVSDLSKSRILYSAMGFVINQAFSDESANCMTWSEEIFLMIMTRERFASFTNRPLTESKGSIGAIYALSVDGFEKVNEITRKGLQAGASEPKPLQDHGFMQLRTLEDFDGHTWEIFYMNPAKIPNA